jgi:hypothetical protein
MNEHLAVLLAALAGASIGLIAGLVILSRGIESRVKALLELRLAEIERRREDEAAPSIVSSRSGETAAAASAAGPSAKTALVAPAPSGPAPEIVAVITAAAYAVIGQPVVLRYALLLADDHHTSWRLVGRTDIFLSHNLRRAT